MVEIINYPHLQLAKERAQVLHKGEYDAVLLVYDVANRDTFEAATNMRREIPARVHRRRSSATRPKPVKQGHNEPIVALVGNKCDFDAEYASVELGLDGPILEKVAEIQQAEIDEREQIHPLYRESRFYDDLPLSPRSLNFFSAEPLADSRRSVMSADNVRASVLSTRRSVKTLPEGKERSLSSLQRPASKTTVIEKWIETGNPSVEEKDEDCEDLTHADTGDTESTTAAKRQVSRLEGEAATQRLQLSVPFFETSAKTGENVEELFEAVIRGVLKDMGIDVAQESPNSEAEKRCRRKHGPREKKQSIRIETRIPIVHDMSEPGATPASAVDSIFSGAQPSEVSSPLTPMEAIRLEEVRPVDLPAEPIPTQQRGRRESVMRRVRSLFFRKPEPVNMADAAA
jgi:GTPase SAR1 family protein